MIKTKEFKLRKYEVFPTTIETLENIEFDKSKFNERSETFEKGFYTGDKVTKEVELLVMTKQEYENNLSEIYGFLQMEKYPYIHNMDSKKRKRKEHELEILAEYEAKERFIINNDSRWRSYKKKNS